MNSNPAALAKVTRPTLPDVLPRKRLFDLLEDLRQRQIICVSGLPGCGKTTLIGSYIEILKIPSLWYNLDERDSDPATFFYYMGLAAKKATPRVRKSLPLLTPEYLPGISAFTRRYFENLCARLKSPALIVFDNYQEVPSEANFYTHSFDSFDVHGSGGGGRYTGGDAGISFRYVENAFQYRKDNAIKIRGKPADLAYIANNVFPHPGLEADRGADAINIHRDGKVKVDIGPGNVINFDSFGKYGVGDFDGDGVDDLFLATGKTWWFSSLGEFHWTYLNAKKERLDQVRLGYFDNDLRCDVLAERNGQWVISSGGSGDWQRVGAFGVPLSEVQFGRFDPSQRDHRPGATRRTTHAFWRAPNGQWFITPLSSPDWKRVQSSSFPMKKLRFGDFTGDGVTDVLAVENGRWAISESARSRWRRLNPSLGAAVGTLFIGNMDPDDNIDDILRLERKLERKKERNRHFERITLTWWRSRNGVEPWRRCRELRLRGSHFAGVCPSGIRLCRPVRRRARRGHARYRPRSVRPFLQ